MLVTNTLIAGSAVSTLYVGLKAIKEDQKRKKTPWTFYAEKIEKRRGRGKKRAHQIARRKNILPEMTSVKSALTRFKEDKINSLFVDPRSEQLKEISANLDEEQINEIERKLMKNVRV